MQNLPPYIALSGYPKAGKSLVQEMLTERYGIEPVDDGRCVRDGVIATFGANEWQVSTQEGKASNILVAGEPVQVRYILGEYAKWLEHMFGEDFIPIRSIELAEAKYQGALGLKRPQAFSFGSVRRNQGLTYAARGGLHLEILRKGCSIVNDFDHYNPASIVHSFRNPLPYIEGVEPSDDEKAAAKTELEAQVFVYFDRFYTVLQQAD